MQQQWLVTALVTDDVKGGGGGEGDRPPPEAHFFEKKQLSIIVSRLGFCPKYFPDTGLRIRGRKFWSAVPLQTFYLHHVAVTADMQLSMQTHRSVKRMKKKKTD